MTTVEEVLAEVDSKLRKRFSTGKDWKAERQSLPSLSLTEALGGGFGYGRICTVYGAKSAGKSSMMLQAIAQAQREGKICAWVDAEKAFDSAWAERLGVDTENLIVTRASDMGRAGDEIVALIEAGVDFVVLDSVSALIQPSYLDKDGESLAGMEKTAKIGDFSKGLKALIRSINYVNEKTLVVLISQSTTMIAQTYTQQIPEGGKAIEFYSSQVVKLNSTRSRTITKQVKTGNRIFDGVVGREVDWTIEFNKLGPAGGTGTYEFYFIGEEVGIDNRLELIDIAMELGIVERKGAWYKWNDESWQGMDRFVDWLDEPENFKLLKKECGIGTA